MTSLRGARVAALASLFLAGACTFGWDALDPRLGDVVGTGGSGLDGGAKNDAARAARADRQGLEGAASGVGGAGGGGAGSTNDASADVTGTGGNAGSSPDAAPDHSETVDAAPDVSVIDAPADVPPADVVSDVPPTLCMGNTCPICPAVVYTSACCKPNNGGCGCMVNIPPGPCM